MEHKETYQSPQTEVFEVKTEGVICGSPLEQTLRFGDNDGSNGIIDDGNYFYGGSF